MGETTRIKKPSSEGKVILYNQWCKKCGICAAFCPKAALAYDESGHPTLTDEEACSSCGLCELLCPDFAIAVPKRQGK